MFALEQVPASGAHPEEAAAGSQSCAPFDGQAVMHDDCTCLLAPSNTQHTVPLAQLAAALHASAVPCPPPPPPSRTGHVVPATQAYDHAGLVSYTQHDCAGMLQALLPHVTV